MTCNCANSRAADLRPTRAAMCQTCPHARREASGAAVECRINGRPVVSLVNREDGCPIGRHPDREGRVCWSGADWLGVPEPIRWQLLWAIGRDARGLVGCGCLMRLKESWAGPWLAPWMEGLGELRQRVASALADWKAI